MIGSIMIEHWKEIEAVLDKYHVREDDKAAALDAYKAICWQWNDANASARAFEECVKEVSESVFSEVIRPIALMRYQRENWPDEWSVCRNSDYCGL